MTEINFSVMAALICALFFRNTPDHSKNIFTVFIDHQNMGVDTVFVP